MDDYSGLDIPDCISITISGIHHDDVIKWKHFPRYWPFVRGINRSPVDSPYNGQWRGALMFSVICALTNGRANNRNDGDLSHHDAHYDVTVIRYPVSPAWSSLVSSQITHWGRATHICVEKLTTIGSDNGLSPGRRQAIIWTIAGILLIGTLGTNFSEILIGIQTFSFKKKHLKMSSAKWRPFVSASMW